MDDALESRDATDSSEGRGWVFRGKAGEVVKSFTSVS